MPTFIELSRLLWDLNKALLCGGVILKGEVAYFAIIITRITANAPRNTHICRFMLSDRVMLCFAARDGMIIVNRGFRLGSEFLDSS